MPPIPLVRQSLRAMKVAEEEPEREGVWRAAPTLAPALAKAADTIDQSCRCSQERSSGIPITMTADPAPTAMTRVSIPISIRVSETRNRYQIIVDRRRLWFQLPDRFWFSVRDLKSTLGDRRSGYFPITMTHAWVEGWDCLGEHGVGRATLRFMPLGGRRIFL